MATKNRNSLRENMKKHSLFALLFLLVAFSLRGEQAPHLILNFDVNKTLIASDKTENKYEGNGIFGKGKWKWKTRGKRSENRETIRKEKEREYQRLVILFEI